MNRRKVFKGLAAVAAAVSVPRLAPAAENLAEIVLRELNTGLIDVVGKCGSVSALVDRKKLRASLSMGRLYLMTWSRCYGMHLPLRNAQVFDFDEFKRLQRATGVDAPANAGWKPLDVWLKEARGVDLNATVKVWV